MWKHNKRKSFLQSTNTTLKILLQVKNPAFEKVTPVKVCKHNQKKLQYMMITQDSKSAVFCWGSRWSASPDNTHCKYYTASCAKIIHSTPVMESIFTILKNLNFQSMHLYTSTLPHLRGKYCSFYFTTFVWKPRICWSWMLVINCRMKCAWKILSDDK